MVAADGSLERVLNGHEALIERRIGHGGEQVLE